MGAESALFTTVIIMGNLIPEALNRASCISASPWEVVAEYVRAPAALAPINAEMAENSDSTFIYSQFISPSAANCARSSTICVWGVIGYADITFGLLTFTAWATANDPSTTTILFLIFPPAPLLWLSWDTRWHRFRTLCNIRNQVHRTRSPVYELPLQDSISRRCRICCRACGQRQA